MSRVTLCPEAGGERLDVYLARCVEGLSRSAAQQLIARGAVRQDGHTVKKNARTAPGRALELDLPEPEPVAPLPQDIPLDVVYEDADLIVVNKPVGMVVHPAPGHPDGTLVNALLYHCAGSLSGINGALRPGIVHRIDRDTSGLVAAAKNDLAHLSLAAQLQDHSLARTYLAVAVGGLREETGTLSAPIGRDTRERKRMAVDWQHGRRAVTHYRVLERLPGHSFLECSLETGRTHQIRVHLASLGHPLLGDRVYGNPKGAPGLEGQCLHAARLRLRHPRTGQVLSLSCPLPDWFQAVLNRLRAQGAQAQMKELGSGFV